MSIVPVWFVSNMLIIVLKLSKILQNHIITSHILWLVFFLQFGSRRCSYRIGWHFRPSIDNCCHSTQKPSSSCGQSQSRWWSFRIVWQCKLSINNWIGDYCCSLLRPTTSYYIKEIFKLSSSTTSSILWWRWWWSSGSQSSSSWSSWSTCKPPHWTYFHPHWQEPDRE